MNKESEELKKEILSLSDDELLKMVNINFADYNEQAISFAKEEINKRGLQNIAVQNKYSNQDTSQQHKQKYDFISSTIDSYKWKKWKMDEKELKNQVINYDTLSFFRKARGLVTAVIIFSILMNLLFLFSGSITKLGWIDIILMTILAIFIYQGSGFANIIMMIYFTISKILQVINSISNGQTTSVILAIVFWPIFMMVFWQAYQVEKARREKHFYDDLGNKASKEPIGEDDIEYTCEVCGVDVPAEAKYCPKCGSKFIDKEETVPDNAADNQAVSTETPNDIHVDKSLEGFQSGMKPKRNKWLFFAVPAAIVVIFIMIFINTKRPSTINPQIKTQINPQPVSQSIKYSNFNFCFEYPKDAQFQEKGYSMSTLLEAKSEEELQKKASDAISGSPNSNSGFISLIWYDGSVANNMAILWYKCIQLEQFNIDRGLSKSMRGFMLTPGCTNFQIREKNSIYWTTHPSVGNVKYQAFSYDIGTNHIYGISTFVLCPTNQRVYTIIYASEYTNPLAEFEKFFNTFKCHLE